MRNRHILIFCIITFAILSLLIQACDTTSGATYVVLLRALINGIPVKGVLLVIDGEEFGTTDCRSLTNCDFSKKEEVDRFMQNEVYKNTCFKQFEYVLAYCLDQI